MVAIVDYDTGNLRSVENALKRAGAEYVLTASWDELSAASHVILPGVGEAGSAMEKLRQSGAAQHIPRLKQPVLGICIGMQLMCRHSEEGDTGCLGIFPTDVVKLTGHGGLKVPHMGWDTVTMSDDPLFDGLSADSYFYYVHSYSPQTCPSTIAVTHYGEPFSAALREGNFYGTQFHPEKSGAVGRLLIENFLKL